MSDAADAITEPAQHAAGGDPLDRVGCSLLTFSTLSLEEALDRVVAHGFGRVDLAIVPGHCDHVDLSSLSEERVAAIRRALGQRRLTVSSVNLVPGDMAADDFGPVERRIQAALGLAAGLGIPVLTLPNGPRVTPERWDAAAERVASRVRGLLGAAQRAGVTIAIEAPHAHTLAEELAQARRLFDLLADPRVACTLDTSHVQRGNHDPLVEALSKIGAPVAHVHLRDTLRGDISVTPGKGDCDYLPFLDALRRSGYGGDLNFELEYEDATPAQTERELVFARQHIGMLLRHEPLPFSHRRYRQRWYRSAEQLAWTVRNPRAFVIAHPSLKAVLRPPVRLARDTWARWVPSRDLRYRAAWQPAWRFGRLPSAISPRRASPVVTGAAPAKRVAILGCGYTGRFEHGPGFARLDGVELVGVCDLQPERARLLGARLGCASFTDFAGLLRSTRPQLVVNCTREWQHRDTTLASFAAGADVFCEKILAESMASGEDMVRAAREQGRVLGVNFNWRYLPGVQRIRQIRDGGELGSLRMLRILAHAWVSHHALDLVRFLAGPVESVQATIRDEPEARGFSEWNPYVHELLYMPTIYLLANLQTRDGVGVSLASTELLDPRGAQLQIDAVFQHGTLTLSGILDADAVGTLTASSGRKVDLRLTRGDAPVGFALAFQRSIEAFFGSYAARTSVPTTGEDALEVMRLENAVIRSDQSGSRIML